MSLFSSILEKLGFGHRAEPSKPTPAPGPSPTSAPQAGRKTCRGSHLGDRRRRGTEGLAAANPQKLNWKTSIVDLLKLLSLDSCFEARKELATELGCPQEKMGDFAQMNIWLHKTVLQKLAENGGNIPKELL